jgi:hypothetical protein
MELPPTSAADESLERLIDALYELMVKTHRKEDARQYWGAMLGFIRERSPEQIFAMEVARRLRRAEAGEES